MKLVMIIQKHLDTVGDFFCLGFKKPLPPFSIYITWDQNTVGGGGSKENPSEGYTLDGEGFTSCQPSSTSITYRSNGSRGNW